MKGGGFYLMHRGWMDNDVFDDEPFSRRAAWVWLIENAAFRPIFVTAGRRRIKLQRGQLCASLRSLARAWQWREPSVRRFLNRLKAAGNIAIRVDAPSDAPADAPRTIITVCNYDKYQVAVAPPDAPSDAPSDAHIESKDKKERKEESTTCSSRARDAAAVYFTEWWDLYPHKVGKSAAEAAYLRALSRASPEALLAGVRRYIATKPPDRQWCNPTTFLNQDRHLDQPAMLLPLPGGQNGNPPRRRQSAHQTLFDAAAELAAEYQHEDRMAG